MQTAENLITVKLQSPPVENRVWDEWQKTFGTPFHATCFIDSLTEMGWQGVYAAEVDSSGVLVSTATALLRTKAGQKWANLFAEPLSLNSEVHSSQKLFKALVKKLKEQGVSFIQT